MIEILVTNYNFDNKNYLIFSTRKIFKKRVLSGDGYNYSTFSSFTSIFPSEYSTTQLMLSPISKFKNCITSLGIVVLADLLLGLARDTFVEYLNTTFIPPIFLVFIVYYMTSILYIDLLSISRNIYIFQSSTINYPKDVIKMDKIEVFGRVLSQEEVEHVFLKAKKLQAQNRVYEEELQKFRSVGV